MRTSALAGTRHELVKALREIADGVPLTSRPSGKTTADRCGCSPGRGSQWAVWERRYCLEPAFAAKVAEIEPLIARESDFSVTAAMSAPETVTGIDRVQPTVLPFRSRSPRRWRPTVSSLER